MIEIERKKDDLNREVWQFSVHGGFSGVTLHPQYYAVETRPTKRHKWRPVKAWRLHQRYFSTIDAKDVPLPDDVQAEAKTQVPMTVAKPT